MGSGKRFESKKVRVKENLHFLNKDNLKLCLIFITGWPEAQAIAEDSVFGFF